MRGVVLVALALTAWQVAPAPAQSRDSLVPRTTTQSPADSALEARTSAVAAKLRCPVCQGESIQDSPSTLAREMRGVVKEKLRAGETPDQIEAYFVARYGEWILLEPTTKGLNLMLYVFPVILVIGGVSLVFFLVRRWTRPAAVADAPSENV
jgi:cytochrome c-type biogenesis protein CcmH